MPWMQGWRSSLVSILSSRRIMVLMASFVTSQGVFSSIYSAYTRIRIQKYTLYKDNNQIYETSKNLGLCWENI